MATGGSFRELFEDLECPICLESLIDPRALRCQHVFCLTCLVRLADGGHVITCPECRKDTVPPVKNKIASLPRPVLLNKLREKIAKILRPPKGAAFTCDLCENRLTAATTRCQECMRNMCGDCEDRHRTTPLFTAHQTIQLTEQSLCEKHTRELLTVFCEQCKYGICVKCAIGNHRDHPLRDLNISVARKYEQLLQWSDNFDDVVRRHEEEVASHETLVSELEEKQNLLSKEIDSWHDSCVESLKSKKCGLLEELEMRCAVERSKLDLYEREIRELYVSKSHLREFIQDMRSTAGQEEDVTSFADGLPDIAMMPDAAKVPSVNLPPFHPPGLGDWLGRVDLGGHPEPPVSPGGRGYSPAPGACTGATARGQDKGQQLVKVMDIPINVKKSKSNLLLEYQEAFVPNHLASWCLADIDTEPVLDVGYDHGRDEYFVATTDHILTFNAKGQEINRIESHQRGCVFDSHRNLFVSIRTMDSQIALLKPSGTRVEKLSVAGLFSGAFLSNITYCARNDAYIMTDSVRHKVKVMDARTREVVHKFKGEAGARLQYPTFIACDCETDHPHNLLAVTDRGHQEVLLFGIQGNARGVYGTGRLLKPGGLCFDRDSRLLVCDTGNMRVVRFSPLENKELEQILCPRDFTGDYVYPNAIALSPDGRLIVSTYTTDGNHLIQIFGAYYSA